MMMLSVDDGDRRGEKAKKLREQNFFVVKKFAISFDAKLTMSRKLRVTALISHSRHLIKVRFAN